MAIKPELKTTVKGRLMGGAIFKPKDQDDGKEPRYGCNLVFEDSEQCEKIRKVCDAAIKDKWPNKKPKVENWGVRVGDDPEYEYSYGKEFINPKSKDKPQLLVKRDGVFREVSEDDDLIYPGCYVAVSVGAFAYDADKDRKSPAGVTLFVRAIMFLKHGEKLRDHVNAQEEFADLDSDLSDESEYDDEMFG